MFNCKFMPFKNLLICLPFALLINSIVISQITPEWTRIHNGQSNKDDGFVNCLVDNSGNLFCGGTTENSIFKDKQLLIKYNSAGSVLWQTVYNELSGSSEYTSDMAIDSAGNVYLCGTKNDSLILLVKYNSSGSVIWGYDFKSNCSDVWVSKIGVDISGDVYITGYGSRANSDENMITMKVDSAGNIEWRKIYNSEFNKNDYSLGLALYNNNIIITGYSEDNILWDALTFKYSADGELVWMKRYGALYTGESGFAVKTDMEGSIFVAGEKGNGSLNRDILTIKYDSSGSFEWQAIYGTSSFDQASDLICDKYGNVYVTGISVQQGTAYTTIKYNTLGLQQWISVYNGPTGGDAANSIALDTFGNIFVTGESYSQNNGTDIATIKYNYSGEQQWVHRFNGTANEDDVGRSVCVDQNNNVYVAGGTKNSFNLDAVIIKYSHLTNGNTSYSNIPYCFKLHQNYPNPFNPVTKIRFELPETGLLSLNIFDVNGKEVILEYFDVNTPGDYSYDINLSNLSSGLYFYKISINGFSDTKKMILLK